MLSIIYALMILIPVELMVNVYRLTRLTGFEMDTVQNVSGFLTGVVVILGTIIIHFLTKKWMEGRKAAYWTAFLWFPYFLLSAFTIASLFPVTNGGGAPYPATGLVMIGALVSYPIYVLVMNFLSLEEERLHVE